MIDVRLGMGAQMLGEEGQHLARGVALLRAIMRPERLEYADVLRFPVDTEQILEPVLDQRIAFHIEEQIAVGGLRQAHQSLAGLGRPGFELRRTTGATRVLQPRLEFYEEWLNPKAMRDGRIGIAPLAAVLSFLRREGDDAYPLVSTRAGQYAAEWTFAELSPLRRSFIRAAPVWLRLRLVAQLMRRLTVRTYRDCRTTVRWKGMTGTVGLTGSLFCVVREPVDQALCGYYASAMSRLMELSGLNVDVVVDRCRATGAERCGMTVSVRVT